MADASVVQHRLDLGRVVRDTFAVLRKQAPLLFGAALLIYLPVSIISGLYTQDMTKASASGDPTAALATISSPAYWIFVFVALLLGCFLYAFQLAISIGELEGRAPTAQEAIQVGLKRCLPLLGASVLFGLGVGLGFVLVIVPGVILAMMWAVTLPAIVERGGVFAGFGQSRNLTRGNRWRILGLFLVVIIAAAVIQAVLTAVAGGGVATGGPGTAVALLVIALYSAALAAFLTVMLGALYVQLREIKGGGGESVAQVFS